MPNSSALTRRVDHTSLLQKAQTALAQANTLPEILEIRNLHALFDDRKFMAGVIASWIFIFN